MRTMTKTLKLKKPAAAKNATQKKDNVKGNVDKTTKRLSEKKDLKYIYPTEIDSLEARKKFRGGNRSRRDSFIKKIANAKNPTEANKLKKEAKSWAKTVFTKEGMPTF